MRICFNVYNVGLANNGGSRTLIRCAETLTELGHEAFFHSGSSRYTWHKTGVKLVGGRAHPACDVTIATGVNSCKTVLAYKKALRCYYVRGLEIWKSSEKKLQHSFREIPHVFVNSVWLRDYMAAHKVQAIVQYPGLDEWFFDQDGQRAGFGALMHNKHKTKRSKDAVKVADELQIKCQFLNKDLKSPTAQIQNDWYNKLKVWFAPTELEGLHNPPIEAALAGCALVCTDHARSGMHDYAVHEETALIYPARDILAAAQCVRRLLDDEELRVRLNRNLVTKLRSIMGSRRERMAEFVVRLENLKDR